MPKKTAKDLFFELAPLDENFKTRWVNVSEFTWDYKSLQFWNWANWCRKSSSIAKEYNVEFDKNQTPWNSIDRVRVNWKKRETDTTTQTIRPDIVREISKKRCVILWTNRSCDHPTEVDHKDWRKDDPRVMNPATQRMDDFQPLSKPANDAKRQFCKECARTWIRYDAKKLWYTVSFTEWDEHYNQQTRCKWCFWYDPIAFRQKLFMRWNQNS